MKENSNLFRYALSLSVVIFLWIYIRNDSVIAQSLKQALLDTYLGVSVLVTLTLLIFYVFEYRHKGDIYAKIKGKNTQIFAATFLGVLPGCGGAVLVVTQYIKGTFSFAALVTVLIATMGDAAFLLLASNPKIFFIVIGVSSVIAIITGLTINLLSKNSNVKINKDVLNREDIGISNGLFTIYKLWFIFTIPAFFMAIMSILRIDLGSLSDFVDEFSIIMCLMVLFVFLASPIQSKPCTMFSYQIDSWNNIIRRLCAESSFVTFWILISFATYNITVGAFDINLEKLFGVEYILMPLIGTLVGFIPGCGPQIITTLLYMGGLIPLSALMANAISNDGDALFPAIAREPKIACKATFITALPALLVGYSFYFLDIG